MVNLEKGIVLKDTAPRVLLCARHNGMVDILSQRTRMVLASNLPMVEALSMVMRKMWVVVSE